MTREEAKKILLLYRPGTADAEDPEIAGALTFAKQDEELSRWLEQHCAQQEKLRSGMRQIPVPAGLKEQIISERIVEAQSRAQRRVFAFAVVAVIFIITGWLVTVFWQPTPPDDNSFANYRTRMISSALRGYGMNFESSDLTKIHDYLAQQKVIDNYDLPAGLQKISATGCAIEGWQATKAAMICFHTGKPLPPGEKNDLWLFIVDRAAVKNAPSDGSPQFAKVNKLTTVTWTKGDKLYLLGTVADEQTIRQWL